jgi:hypothetical protein
VKLNYQIKNKLKAQCFDGEKVQVFTINRDEKSDMVEPTRIREEHF